MSVCCNFNTRCSLPAMGLFRLTVIVCEQYLVIIILSNQNKINLYANAYISPQCSMEETTMNLQNVVKEYGIICSESDITALGTGLINSTWKINAKTEKRNYVLQSINTKVFSSPRDIASNLELLRKYLHAKHPDYLFISPLHTQDDKIIIEADDNIFFRLFPYVEGSVTHSSVRFPEFAFEAAQQFGKFTKVLSEFNSSTLKTTIPDFHNLEMRFSQFTEAITKNRKGRKPGAQAEIDFLLNQEQIVKTYKTILTSPEFKQRVTHHDTKISNVLFNNSNHGICVIDLDTTMPGLFISDVGDMFRTYLSDSTEEDKDYDKVEVRPMFFEAVIDGYLSQVGALLTKTELDQFLYSGYFIIYMQALRFLADYLNGDIYYTTHYEDQNLVRARNQIRLFQSFKSREKEFLKLVRGR
jgi:Ser/Thr protein kinase RdoA (MazF antagonist)